MQYAKPTTAAEAARLLGAESGVTRVLAGGTDVMVQLKAGMIEPALIVDIKGIPGMRDIVAEAGGFRIGAAVTGAEMAEHAALCAMYPGVTEAATTTALGGLGLPLNLLARPGRADATGLKALSVRRLSAGSNIAAWFDSPIGPLALAHDADGVLSGVSFGAGLDRGAGRGSNDGDGAEP